MALNVHLVYYNEHCETRKRKFLFGNYWEAWICGQDTDEVRVVTTKVYCEISTFMFGQGWRLVNLGILFQRSHTTNHRLLITHHE